MDVRHLSITNANVFDGATAIEGIVPRLLQATPPESVGAPSCPVLLFTVDKKRPSSVSENSQRYSPAEAPPPDPPPGPPPDPPGPPPDTVDPPPQLATPSTRKDVR